MYDDPEFQNGRNWLVGQLSTTRVDSQDFVEDVVWFLGRQFYQLRDVRWSLLHEAAPPGGKERILKVHESRYDGGVREFTDLCRATAWHCARH